MGICSICGYMSSQSVCKACVLLEGLNKGQAKVAIGSDRQRRRAQENIDAMARLNIVGIAPVNTSSDNSEEKHECCGDGGCGN